MSLGNEVIARVLHHILLHGRIPVAASLVCFFTTRDARKRYQGHDNQGPFHRIPRIRLHISESYFADEDLVL